MLLCWACGRDASVLTRVLGCVGAADAELKDLDSKKHSGGERSFSTMMYLLALQASTPCPFRIVDEINQGMDELNERMVFEMLLRANASEESTQYFVVSPKLLSNLRYRPYVRVHVVNAVSARAALPRAATEVKG